jgi:hypothetical protein
MLRFFANTAGRSLSQWNLRARSSAIACANVLEFALALAST